MANKNFLDSTGVALVWSKIKLLLADKVDKVEGKGLSTNDYTADEKAKLANIAAGAEVNVNADWDATTGDAAILNKPTALSDFTNDAGFITTSDIPEGAAASTSTPLMDGTAAVGTELAFARGDHRHPTDTSRASASDVTALTGRVSDLEDAVGSGGSVDSKIQTAIQGLDSSITATTNQAISSITITDGKITASTKATIPTNNNQLTNGAGYQTASDVSTAIASAIGDLEGVSFSIVQSLPATGDSSIIYLVSATGGSGNDVYDEFIWLSGQSKFEKIGRTDVDLSDYYNTTNLIPITSAEIDTICV